MDENYKKIDYFEETKNGLATIIANIKSGHCVLALGPLFGIDDENKNIHEKITQLLREEDPSLIFDDDFQNLYLVEQMHDYDSAVIEEMIVQAYDRAANQYSDIYNKIAQVNFNAIVNFTQDMCLVDAFKKNSKKYQFSYFSLGKPQEEFQAIHHDKEYKSLPFIYNVFGNYKHKESLIYTYDKFYKFFFSILGESNVFPDEVVNRLSNARVFLLLGFDLKKWYVPIFIAKLCKIGRENKDEKPLVIAALNDTNKENLPYVRWLTRYPLKLRFVKNSHAFIEKLAIDAPTALGNGIGYEDSLILSANEKNDFRERLGDCGTNEELISMILEFKLSYEKKKNTVGINFMIERRMELRSAVFTHRDGQLSDYDLDVKVAKIRSKLLSFISDN